MPAIKTSDLNYSDYSWTTVPGDNPAKRHEDANRFSRKEGYEVIHLLNSLTGQNGSDLLVRTRLVCEWMIHEKLPSDVQGRSNVISWIASNYDRLSPHYPF